MTTQLYLISPPSFTLNDFKPQLEECLKIGLVSVFQLRLKDVCDEEILTAATELTTLCHRYGAQCIINDRTDIAQRSGADGVHLGHDDDSIKYTRANTNTDFIIGASCYDSPDLAIRCAQAGADYVSFGAFYPTSTKEVKANPSADVLTFWHENSTIPCCAIGGITSDNSQILIDHGADFLCVIGYVWNHPNGPAYAVKTFQEILPKADI